MLCGVNMIAFATEPSSSQKTCAQAVVVIGKVTLEPSGQSVGTGEKLVEGTRIKTSSDAFLKLLLKDNSVIDISPQTQFVLKQCAAPEITGIDLELELGRVRANVNPEPARPRKKFQMKTPTSVLAVRGTEFFVSWAKDNSGSVNERVSVSEGQVEVRSLFQQNAPPTLLQTGTEFRAEGILQNENRQPPRIDQFNAPEQRKLEREQKIEDRVFLEAIQSNSRLSPKKQGKDVEYPKRAIEAVFGGIVKQVAKSLEQAQRREVSSVEGSGNSLIRGGDSQTSNTQNSQNTQNTFVKSTVLMNIKK